MQRAQRTGTTSPPLQHKNTQSRPCNVQQCSNGISNSIRQSHQSEAAPCKRTHRRVAVRQSCVDCRVQTLSTRRDGCIARLVFDQRVFAEEIADAEARELLLGRSAGDHPRNDHLSAGRTAEMLQCAVCQCISAFSHSSTAVGSQQCACGARMVGCILHAHRAACCRSSCVAA
jgi:hypothetical protein